MLSVLEQTTTRTEVERSTLIRAHYALQSGIFFSEADSHDAGLYASSSATPIPMWNHAAWISGDSQAFENFVKKSSDWLAARNRRPTVYVTDDHAPEESILAAKGFEKFDEEAWMRYAPGTEAQEPELDESACRVRSEEEFQHFLSTFHASYQTRGSSYAEALKSTGNGSVEHFVLYDGNQSVSIGTLIARDGFGFIYNIGTPPAQRNKGYARRIVQHLTARALELDCKTLLLQVENNSGAKRLYEKIGFKTIFLRRGYRLPNWVSATPPRTPIATLLGFRPGSDCASGKLLRTSRPLEGDLPRRVESFAGNLGISAETVFLATWSCLVHRYTGDELVEFAFCGCEQKSPSARKISVDPKAKISDWLRSLSANVSESGDLAQQEVLLRVPGSSSNQFEVASFPLEVTVNNAGSVDITFRSDLFSKDAIARMARHFGNILEEIIRSPGNLVGSIDLLSAREKHQLLVEWNQSAFTPTRESLQQMFEAQVERTPDSTSLVFTSAHVREALEQLSYRQLNRKANKLAHRLKKLGVGPTVFVGVCLHRSLDMIVSLLAIFKAGGACVPLDPAYPADRLSFMAQDTKAPVIITESSLLNVLKESTRSNLLCLDKEWNQINGESEKNPPVVGIADDAAYVIYTSGSTGKPKGVVVSKHAIANHSLECKTHYGLSPHDRILQFSSFNFDASFEQILPALISGAALIVRDDEIWTTTQFAEKLQTLQLTVADIPTAYWHELTDEWHQNPSSIPPHNLRLVIVGGEALSLEKLKLWLRTPVGKVRLINAYGPTETTITAASYEVPRGIATDGDITVLPIGRPRGDRKAYVLDPLGNPAPIGIPGELHIGGSLLAKGYHNRPELTAEKFIPNPFSDEADARLYRSGDLVRYLEDGNLEFLGRIDDQVKIRGFRIELGEIESCLLKHRAVREALVIARPDASGEKRLVAYFLGTGQPVQSQELRDYLKGFLPHYMLPSAIVGLEQWPLMPNGKVDRRALPEPVEEPSTAGIAGPREPLELQLQLIFERVLKRAPIGIDASFFELGGDSLQALELLVEIEKATGKSLPMGTLYQSSTVESLAREVQERSTEREWSSLVPLQTSGTRPPFFLLHTTPGDILGYGNLVFRLGVDQPCYGFQSLGLKDSSLSHTRVEEMADYYVALLKQFQPQGPYFLGGWCYGGIVAVEMARLLKERGDSIAMLALLETVALPPGLSNYSYYVHRLKCTFRMGFKRWREYVREKAKYARDSRMANRMRFREALGDASLDLKQVDPRLAKLESVYNTNLAALKHYRTHYYDGTVTLFNAAEKDPALIPDPYYGWVGLAKEIEILEVPGNHDTMLTEPNVSVLASRLEERLRSAQEKFKPGAK